MKKIASLMLGFALATACVAPTFADDAKPKKAKKVKKNKKKKGVN